MKTIANAADRRWNVDRRPSPDLTPNVIRHLGPDDGWSDGMWATALIRGAGHPSHVTINGYQYAYIGTVSDGPEAGNTLYRSY